MNLEQPKWKALATRSLAMWLKSFRVSVMQKSSADSKKTAAVLNSSNGKTLRFMEDTRCIGGNKNSCRCSIAFKVRSYAKCSRIV